MVDKSFAISFFFFFRSYLLQKYQIFSFIFSELKTKSFDWFYKNVSEKFKRFGSAKVVRSLYKHADMGSRGNKYHCKYEATPFDRYHTGYPETTNTTENNKHY